MPGTPTVESAHCRLVVHLTNLGELGQVLCVLPVLVFRYYLNLGTPYLALSAFQQRAPKSPPVPLMSPGSSEDPWLSATIGRSTVTSGPNLREYTSMDVYGVRTLRIAECAWHFVATEHRRQPHSSTWEPHPHARLWRLCSAQ